MPLSETTVPNSGYVPPRPRRDYPIYCRHIIDLARDLFLGSILLDYGFTKKPETSAFAAESVDEAIYSYPKMFPKVPMDHDFGIYKLLILT
jgi:hypothetical protein